jgi:enamine deaminase RidA (YjgF/YER057c/UK114 family)
MKIEKRLEELGITLPPPSKPAGTYARVVQIGDMLYIAGTGPIRSVPGAIGKLGRDLTVEQGAAAARSCGIQILATLKDTLGDLDRVKRLVKTLGMVNATPDFTEHVQVVNGVSNFFVEVFGEEKGKGARSAVGMGSLPGGISVEVETMFQIES